MKSFYKHFLTRSCHMFLDADPKLKSIKEVWDSACIEDEAFTELLFNNVMRIFNDKQTVEELYESLENFERDYSAYRESTH